jgi:hypothetical protein
MALKPRATILPRRLAGKATSASKVTPIPKGSDVTARDQLSVIDGQTVRSLRQTNKIVQALRLACRLDGTLSTAVYDLVQIANSGLRVRAYNSTDHRFNYEATVVAHGVLSRMNTLADYTKGYADRRPLGSVLETALRETVLTGAIAGELVMDAARLPERIQIVPFETVVFKSRGDGTKYPVQRGITPQEISLDIPNFWIIESHLGADSPYPRSMLEAGLPTVFHYMEFIEDMRRVTRNSGHSRMVMTLNAEQVRAAAPEAAQKTEAAMKAYMEGVREELQNVVSSLEPEEALVVYDVAEAEVFAPKGIKTDYSQLLQTLAGMTATSLKSHPSILGLRLQGSQSLSNTESLIFLQVAAAAQTAVAGFMSRALTLSTRLFGVDAYVKAEFRPINLRPEDELEAFKVMKQDRILDQLSLGLITDDEACFELDLPPRAPGAPPLSGTFFRDSASQNRAGEVSPNQDPMGRALQPDTPTRGGGRSQ